ncbi:MULTISPECIES: hypothetical protein [Proteiniphilum]|uniref:hypothetical protein n=1 Tax=Proteiniphilum TaxID=294702 RepID=UPI001EEB7BFC|nr:MULTISPECIES: hypothetical protein [Proteiniphilum]ULB33977.1 hypothetical protein KDN43_13465 [Proteiniphilum propionicum]
MSSKNHGEQEQENFTFEVVDGDECYEFTWVGKKQSIIEGNHPIRKTVRPGKEEIKDWNTTENLYIEGDNLDVLKLLQNPYLNKVKMIYIDPPYNTGNDFVYRDNFKVTKEDYEEDLGLFDEEENDSFGTEIFIEPTLKGKLGVNAIPANKHLYDYVIFDSP